MKVESSSSPAVAIVEGYGGSPRFATPMSMCEIDGLHDAREPTIAQLLQEKALYSYSEWPKVRPGQKDVCGGTSRTDSGVDLLLDPPLQDRIIINRLDSICHAILKGKWPSSSEQYDSPGSMAATSCLANSLAQHHHQRASFLAAATTASGSVSGQARLQQANAGLGFTLPPPLTRIPKVSDDPSDPEG